MAQAVRVLAMQARASRFYPQHPCMKPDDIACTCNASAGDVRTDSLVESISPRSQCETLVSINMVD